MNEDQDDPKPPLPPEVDSPPDEAAVSIPITPPAPPARLASIDAFRGLVMLAMISSGLGLGRVAKEFPESPFWRELRHQLDHVEWVGCAAWDLIQPSFMFLVGTALAFSAARRRAVGQSRARIFAHAGFRAVFLTLLGVFLRSNGSAATNWTFEDVTSQIGLGYFFLFLLSWTSLRAQLAAAGGILLGVFALFALWPLPAADYDWAAVGVAADWPHKLDGFAAHWNKNANPSHYFDTWFLNLFGRSKLFTHNGGGYQTLSFLPSLATMTFGLAAGGVLLSTRRGLAKVGTLLGAGIVGLALGWVLDWAGICPNVKRIWTPTWAIFSTGWVLVLLAVFYFVVDVVGLRRWAWPLTVVGMNSIAVYVLNWLVPGWVKQTVQTHFGADAFHYYGEAYSDLIFRSLTVALLFLVAAWMHRRKIFLRV